MMQGLLFGILAGSLVGLQNIFNSKVNERAGSWTTTSLVLGMGFLSSLMMGLLVEGSDLFALHPMKTWYWFSGAIGVGVVICLVQGIKLLGPTYAISIVLTSQLGFALAADSFGWLGLTQVPFTIKHLIGVIVIISGMLLFKLGGIRQDRRSTAVVQKPFHS
ncbi:MAG: DMT family transporter [Clostridia bacterium]